MSARGIVLAVLGCLLTVVAVSPVLARRYGLSEAEGVQQFLGGAAAAVLVMALAVAISAWFKTPATRVPPEGSCVCAPAQCNPLSA